MKKAFTLLRHCECKQSNSVASIGLSRQPCGCLAMAKGFTLIELSIVLVIIGLIIGGVLVGRDLIRAAEIRTTFAQIESYKTAANTFKLKYNCMAGDCNEAVSLLPSGSTTSNGNGNFKVGQIWGTNEGLFFWQHLALAELIPGSYTGTATGAYVAGVNYPAAKLGGGIGIGWFGDYNAGGAVGAGLLFPANYGHTLFLGEEYSDLSSRVPLFPLLTAPEAFSIDTKFDDGRPAYGTMITWQSSTGYGGGGCATTDTASTAVYSSNRADDCNILFPNAIY